MELNTRNEKIDIVRGIAILMVVLGHTVQYFLNGSQTLLSNVFFSLQMPLFMLISGYVCKYSKPIDSFKVFFERLLKRSRALLLPWLVWTILRFFIVFRYYLGYAGFFAYVRYIITHMDSGYWFLFSLWTIDLIVSMSELFSKLMKFTSNSKIVCKVIQMFFVGVFFVALGIIGKSFGMQIISIKYTLYYIPFFCLGYLFGEFNGEITSFKHYRSISTLLVSVSALAYIVMILQFDIQGMSDNVLNIFIRIIMSLTGCAVLIYVVSRSEAVGKISNCLCYFGKHSLEVYLVHDCFLNIIRTKEIVLGSVTGVFSCLINYALCLSFTVIVVYMIGKIPYLNRILFGKK